MKDLSEIRSKPLYRKALLCILAAIAFFTLFGFFGLPPILRAVLVKDLSGTLHREVRIREIRVNPFILSVTIRGLSISERGNPGTWISVGEIFANLQLASIYRGGPVLGELQVLQPYARIVRHPDGRYNFSDLVEEFSRESVNKSKPLKYSLNNILIHGGSIDFLDGPKNARHEVRGIELSVPSFSNLPYYADRYVRPFFAAIVNGDAVSLTGRTKPFSTSLETTFDVNLMDLEIPRYLEYLPFPMAYDVPTAYLDVKGEVSFVQHKDKTPQVRVSGDVILRRLLVKGKDGSNMVLLPRVHAVISPSNVASREFRLASLTITDPEVDAMIDKAGHLNLLSLVPPHPEEVRPETPEGAGTPAVKEEGGKARVSMEALRLTGGKVRFSDASRSAMFRTTLRDIGIGIDRFGTEPGKTADFLLSAVTESGETFEGKGNLSLSPLSSEGTVRAGKLLLKKYAPYYSGAVRFDVGGGTLDLRTGWRYAEEEGRTEFRFSGLDAGLSGLRLRQREEREDFLDIPALLVKGAEIDMRKREAVIGELSTRDGKVFVRRRAGGEVNLARLTAETPAGSAPPGTGTAKGRGADSGPWAYTLKKVSVDRYAVRIEDGTTDPPVNLAIDRVQLRAENLTSERNRKGRFSLSFATGPSGTVGMKGSVALEPPGVAAKLSAADLPIGPVQPYFGNRVRILVTAGSVSAGGDVAVDATKGRPVRVAYRGAASVNGFASVDKARGEEFLDFDSLHFGKIAAGANPAKVSIDDIALTDFRSRIIVNPDATLNLQGIVAKHGAVSENGTVAPASSASGSPPPTDNAASAAAVPVRIGTITLQGGAIRFSDHFVRPNYSASLVEIGGRISGLSSEEGKLADVDLQGKLENSAPLEIRGKINPLAKNLYVDLKVDFKDMDLSPLTPYSGKYAGYGIEKGKLTLNLSYLIEKGNLKADNRVFLDQFTFGAPMESPEATKLPVRLAVALLKDRNGEIQLDLPVSGRLDDPKFSVWRVALKIVVNLLVKAATSPFALLGALFGGGGEELSYLEFPPGSAAIPPEAAVKLDGLTKALHDRPGLKLEIEGHVDPEKDREALRQIAFRTKLAAAKVRDLVKTGQAAPSLDNVRIAPAEYPTYLARAYKEEKFPKPRNILGMAKTLPVPEMEKLMLTHIRVTEGDLRLLAVARASAVQNRLLATKKVEPGQVFLVEAKALSPEKKGKLSDSRVDFRIR